MEEAYRRQQPLALVPLAVNADDHLAFLQLCRDHNFTAAGMFNFLLNNYDGSILRKAVDLPCKGEDERKGA